MWGTRIPSSGGLRGEISRIKKLARQGEVPVNDFVGLLCDQGDFPCVAEEIKRLMPSGYALSVDSGCMDSGIPSGKIEFQKWTHGVQPHDDDVEYGFYFMVYCLGTKEVSRGANARRIYDSETTLHGPNYLKIMSMEPGSVGVFNPRETHCLVHAGLDVLIAIVSVEKVNEAIDGKEKE